jgi:hypothetical protein
MGQNNGPGDGGQTTYEPIYTPYRVGGLGGPQATLPNQGDGQPGQEVVGQGPSDQQNSGQVNVPYNEVFPAYRDTAYSAMDNGDYPSELQDVVRQYFSSLDPSSQTQTDIQP